jgi:hypothetical protein
MAIRLNSYDINSQSGCRLPICSIVARSVGRSNNPVLAIGVSSYILNIGPTRVLKKEVIAFRTWLWADVLASLNFGQTQAK